MSLAQSQRELAFFLCWTRKEAYIKAIGDGLSTPLQNFRVTLQPDQDAGLIHVGHDSEAAKAWTCTISTWRQTMQQHSHILIGRATSQCSPLSIQENPSLCHSPKRCVAISSAGHCKRRR